MGAKGSGISILQCQWLQRGALQLAVLIPQFAVLIPHFAVLFPTFLVAVPAFLVVVLACVPSCGYTPVSSSQGLDMYITLTLFSKDIIQRLQGQQQHHNHHPID